MDTTIIIARLMGPVLLLSAAAIVLNRKGLQKVELDTGKSTALVYLAGFVMLVAGLAVVEFHNLWTPDWKVIVTILGWLTLIGGALRMLIPEQLAKAAKDMARKPAALLASAAISAILGTVLVVKSFGTTI